MNCPECGSDTKVLDTRFNWRRRQCLNCNHKFNTVESITTKGFKAVIAKKAEKPVIVLDEVIPEVKAPKKEKSLTVTTVKRNADARRKIEDLKERRRFNDDFDFMDDDFNYLPDKW